MNVTGMKLSCYYIYHQL